MVEIHWSQVGIVRQEWQHFPATCLNVFLGHIGDMRAGVVVQQEDSMLPIRSSLLNSHLESFHLLNIEFRVDRLVLFNQSVMDNPFPVAPHAHRFTRIDFFHAQVACLPRLSYSLHCFILTYMHHFFCQ